jgi:hypothetical protein
MSDDFNSEDEKETGSTLRSKYEQAIETNKALQAELVEMKAKDLISSKGYKHLSVEDLSGVDLSELEAKAEALEAQKAAADAEAVRRVLAGRGLDDSQLDAALATILGSTEGGDSKALDRIAAAGKIVGTPPSAVEDETLYGPSRIRAAYAK